MIAQEAINLIKHFESLHDGDLTQIGLQPKKDPISIWTVGFGRALKHPTENRWLKGDEDKEIAHSLYPSLTLEQAESMLKQDLIAIANRVRQFVNVDVTTFQFGALCSFVYNLGIGNFKSSTLLKKLNREDYKGAANEFLKWNKAGGKVLRGLTLRRQAEKTLFETGKFEIK